MNANKTTDEVKALPWICPDHPEAQIRYSWDRTYYVFSDGYPRGGGVKTNHKYECAECGRKLAAPLGD